MRDELQTEKKEALRVAKDLMYPLQIIEAIKNAETTTQIGNALIAGRHGQDDIIAFAASR